METRDKILDVATELFARYGVRAVTMEDIARSAGISKKTIYQEFADKKDLVKVTFARLLEEDRNKIEALADGADDLIEQLILMSRTMRERLSTLNPMVVVEVQKYFPEAWRMFEDFKVKIMGEDLVRILEKGKNLGYFRPEIDSAILAKVRVNQITSSLDPANFTNPNYNFVEEQLVLLDHFLHGIFTEKGRESYRNQLSNET